VQPILWLLKGKLQQPIFMQQYATAQAGRPLPRPAILPWRLREPAWTPGCVHSLLIPPTFFQISEQTKDSTGAALGGATAKLFVTATDVMIESQVSNADGYAYFKMPAQAVTHYIVAYKSGSPDVTGATLNTLVGA
jgi:hypothetical protein